MQVGVNLSNEINWRGLELENKANCQKRIVMSGGVSKMNVPSRKLLTGIWTSLTKKPMKPMTAKPTAVAVEIFRNSVRTNQMKTARKLLV